MSITFDITNELGIYQSDLWQGLLPTLSLALGFTGAALVLLNWIDRSPRIRKRRNFLILSAALITALTGTFFAFQDLRHDAEDITKARIDNRVWREANFYYIPSYVIEDAWENDDEWIAFTSKRNTSPESHPELFELRMDRSAHSVELRKAG